MLDAKGSIYFVTLYQLQSFLSNVSCMMICKSKSEGVGEETGICHDIHLKVLATSMDTSIKTVSCQMHYCCSSKLDFKKSSSKSNGRCD